MLIPRDSITGLAGTRVLFLNWRDPAHPLAGGAEVYCWEIARRFAAGGAEVTLLTSRPRGAPARAVIDGVRVHRRGGTYSLYAHAAAFLAANRRRFDAVVDWFAGAGTMLLIAAWRLVRPRRADKDQEPGRHLPPAQDRSSGEPRPLRILHLAFDDHRFPGSGGGAIRTFEVNRRLAQRHQVTVVTMNYKGARRRTEEGVRYVQVGTPWGYFGRIISYLLCLPLALRRYPSDLVVEDFTPPISTALVPLWTRRPVVGMVQWLWARQKSRQYKMPFFLVEELGVRTYRQLIAVSSDIATRLHALNPAAEVTVIPNGVEQQHISTKGLDKVDLVFLGRIELEAKGLDLLLRAFAKITAAVDAKLVIAGDGRDRERVRRLADELSLHDRIQMVGRVTGAAKSELLARARLVCVPSRYEVFPLVPLEAQAAGTPVLAFDIAAMGEVLAPDGGVLVPPFDVDTYADAMQQLLHAPERCQAMGEAGRRFVRRFHWDLVARQQEHVYLEAVSARSGNI